MSNTTYSRESLIFQFLSSKEFIKELMEKDLVPKEHNLLLSAHLLAVGFNTSGISEGGVNVEYWQNLTANEDFTTPKSGFYFYTTKNGLIQERNHYNRQTIRLNNKFFFFNDTTRFRDFCIKYFEKYSKNSIPVNRNNEEKPDNNSIKFRLQKRKRDSEEGQNYGYQSIVCGNPLVKSIIESWYLDKELPLNLENKPKSLKL